MLLAFRALFPEGQQGPDGLEEASCSFLGQRFCTARDQVSCPGSRSSAFTHL